MNRRTDISDNFRRYSYTGIRQPSRGNRHAGLASPNTELVNRRTGSVNANGQRFP